MAIHCLKLMRSGFAVYAACLWIFILLTATPLTAYAEGPIRISLKSKIEVNSDTVHLKDLANISAGDAEQRAYLEKIQVGRAPLPGKSRRIKRNYIELKLRQYDIDLARIRFDGPSEVSVGRVAVQADPAIIRANITEFLQNNAPWAGSDLKIEAIKITSDKTLPAGRTDYAVVAPRGGPYTGILPLSVRVSVNGDYEKIIRTQVKLKAFRKVVVARHPIGRLRPITMADLALKKVDIGRLPPDPLTDLNTAVGKRTRSNVMVGSVLRTDAIELPPVVKRGDMVLIVAQSSGLRITAIGEVRSSGRAGDRVKVVNVDSRKAVLARVVDEGTVAVDF